MKYFFSLLVLFFPLCSSSVLAQHTMFSEEWRWSLFTTAYGLPSNRVLGIADAPDGTPWVSTERGLAYYNGYRWKIIDSSLGLPQSTPSTPQFDSLGNVYTIVQGKLFAGSTKGFRLFFQHHFTELKNEVNSFAFHPRYGIIVELGHTIYYVKNNRLEYVPPVQGYSNAGKNLWSTVSGTIWWNQKDGLYKWENESWKLFQKGSPLHSVVIQLVEDTNGNGCVAYQAPTSLAGVWEWHGNKTPHKVVRGKDAVIKSIDINNNSDVFALYRSGDILFRTENTWSRFFSVPSKLVHANTIRFRTNGDVWVCSEEGLYLYKQSSQRWTSWKHSFPDPRNTVNEIFLASDSSLWIATLRGVEVRKKNGKHQWITRVNGTLLNEVTSIGEDMKGNIWIGSGSSIEGAFRWNGISWKHFGPKEGLHVKYVHKIKKDIHGKLWFLGFASVRWDNVSSTQPMYYEKNSFHTLPLSFEQTEGRIYSMTETHDGAYWFATAKGISRLRNGVWKHWNENPFNIGRVFTIATDTANTIWFADQWQHFGFIDNEDSIHWESYSGGLLQNNVWSISTLSTGTLIAGTTNGLVYYRNKTWSLLQENSGLQHLNIWPVLPVGDKIYIGTTGAGVQVLHIDTASAYLPIVELEKPIIEKSTISFSWMPFSYYDNISSANIRTRYRIDSSGWSEWTTNHTAIVHSISDGTHALHVQATDLFGSFSPAGNSLQFIVEPPYYKQPWYYIPISVLIFSLLFAMGFIIDRRIKNRRTLLHSEARYRAIVEDQTELICRFSSSGTLTFVNNAYSRYFGTPANQLLGVHVHTVVVEEDRAHVQQHLTQFTPEANIHTTEYRVVTSDNSIHWNAWTTRALFDEYGQVLEFQSAGRDITEKKLGEEMLTQFTRELEQKVRERTEELNHNIKQLQEEIQYRAVVESALQESEGRFRGMIENTPIATFVVDEHGLFEFVNEAYRTMLLYTAQELIGQHFTKVYKEANGAALAEKWSEYIVSTRIIQEETILRTKNNQDLLIKSDLIPISDTKGNRKIAGFALDVTSQKRAEEEIRNALEKEKELRALKSRFISMVSHELRTPLTTIFSNKELLEQFGFKWDEVKRGKAFQRITNSVQRMTEMLDDVLFIGRFESGKLEFLPMPTDSVALCHEVIEEIFSGVGKHHAVKFSVEGTAAIVMVDPKFVRQILTNLLVNAIKYSEQGTTVHLTLAFTDSLVAIVVRDEGIGIPAEDKKQLFESFHRASNVGNIQGTGLGLTIVKQCAELHHGSVRVTSELDKGTTFTVQLPQNVHIEPVQGDRV